MNKLRLYIALSILILCSLTLISCNRHKVSNGDIVYAKGYKEKGKRFEVIIQNGLVYLHSVDYFEKPIGPIELDQFHDTSWVIK